MAATQVGQWITVTFPTQNNFNGDFFIIAFIYKSTTMGIATDGAVDYGDRGVCSNNLSTWNNYASEGHTGDMMLRATVSYSGIEENEGAGKEGVYSISPNPVINRSVVSYTIKENSKVSLKIYDIAGKEVKTIANGIETAGTKKIEWNARDNVGKKINSGVYFCKMQINNKEVATKSLIIL
ncbi:MAG: FlgD immunoglobulin-like domain containing protein [bacterium]